VLIADDHEAMRKLLRGTVEGIPIPAVIYEAADGDEAIRFARSNRPDLALVDIVLPGSEASGAIAYLRKPFSVDEMRSKLEGWLSSRPCVLWHPRRAQRTGARHEYPCRES